MTEPRERIEIVCGRVAETVTLLVVLFSLLFVNPDAWAQRSRMIFEHPFIVAARAGEIK
ncbi:MAG: hypothetical protein CFH10_01614, partial [Alphaproteobacteria bacterium MarineAlpha4_Bin2]